jgi:tRNA nucleotidyltransferase (CCA-adding enzyme)
VTEAAVADERAPASLLPALDRLPGPTLELLRRAGEIAAAEGAALYLVGGAVRDLARGATNLDLDLVAEADGIRLARAVGDALGGEVRPHGRFGTATVTLPEGRKLDFATARRERYPRPGSALGWTPGPKNSLWQR